MLKQNTLTHNLNRSLFGSQFLIGLVHAWLVTNQDMVEGNGEESYVTHGCQEAERKGGSWTQECIFPDHAPSNPHLLFLSCLPKALLPNRSNLWGDILDLNHNTIIVIINAIIDVIYCQEQYYMQNI